MNPCERSRTCKQLFLHRGRSLLVASVFHVFFMEISLTPGCARFESHRRERQAER